MSTNSGREPATLGEFDYGNGRSGRHPIRRRWQAGAPAWVRTGFGDIRPIEATASEQVVLRDGKPALRGNWSSNDATHGERDRSFESEMADLEVWD